MDTATRVLILMSKTGGGHWAAAQALRAAFTERYGTTFRVDVVDLWADHTAWPLNWLPRMYVPMVVHTPRLWRWMYCTTRRRRILGLGMRAAWPLAHKGVRRALAIHRPDIAVAVHPLLQEIAMRVLSTLGWRTPFVTVVTDLVTIHPAWFQRDATLCFVPTQHVFQEGIRAGLRHVQMRVCGLPIRPAFSTACEPKGVVRHRLGMAPDLPTALVVGGGEGMGGMAAVARTLATALAASTHGGRPLGQLAVVCGRNAEMAQKLRAECWPVPTLVEDFVDEIWSWMAASDCLVTKAGPATIAEGLALGLPMLLIGHVPGQEEGNVAYVVENGAGAHASTPGEAAEVVRHWFRPGGECLAQISERAGRMGRPDAAFCIAEQIAALRA